MNTWMRLLFVGASLAACRPAVPLSEVAIVGGSERQRAAVSEELAAFESWVGPDAVALSVVRFGDVPPGRAGQYIVRPQRIELAEARSYRHTRRDLRHELCHAIDRQLDLASEPIGLLDEDLEAVAAYLQGLTLEPTTDLGSEDSLRREALALLCEAGPYAADIARSTDCGDPRARDRGSWLLQTIWQQYAPLDVLPMALGDRVTAEGSFTDLPDLDVRDTETPGVIEVETWGNNAFVAVTGEVHADNVDPIPPSHGETPPVGLVDLASAALATGETLVVVDADFNYAGRAEKTWMAWSQEADWRIEDSCTLGRRTAFSHDERLWMAWSEEPNVFWQPVDID